MSRKPSVISRAVFAPLRSSSALMAIVDPCRNSSASEKRAPAFSTPSEMPSTRWAGVLRVLQSISRPVLSSKLATSVKVPPISAASLVRSLEEFMLAPFSLVRSFFNDTVAKDAQPLQLDLTYVARLHPQLRVAGEPDARRRTCDDDVPGRQRESLTER